MVLVVSIREQRRTNRLVHVKVGIELSSGPVCESIEHDEWLYVSGFLHRAERFRTTKTRPVPNISCNSCLYT